MQMKDGGAKKREEGGREGETEKEREKENVRG